MNYIALICARGGSKGLPGKNIKKLAGTPLIGLAIKAANHVERISQVIVSTDSKEIAEIAKDHGADVPFIRPAKLAQDNSSEWLVWRHALEYLKNQRINLDALVVVPATAPLRDVEDINQCLDMFEKGGVDVVVTVTDARRSPYFNMLKVDDQGYSSLVNPYNGNIVRRQDTPDVFDMTTVAYVVRPEYVFESTALLGGRVKSVHIPPERALDIDTPLDFEIASLLLSKERDKNEIN